MSVVLAITLTVILVLVGFVFFMNRREGVGIAVVGFALVFGSLFTSYSINHYNERTIECSVTDKDRGVNKNGGSNYRVYTDCGTFVNEDSIWRGKFDSGDIQGEIQIGKTYEFTVAGPRFGPFSMFPNIYGVEEVG